MIVYHIDFITLRAAPARRARRPGRAEPEVRLVDGDTNIN